MNYIVNLGDRLLCFYYVEGGGISYRVFENGKWGAATTLLKEALEHYSVTLDEKGHVFLFCQDSKGDIILCTEQEASEWDRRVILQNESGDIVPVQMHPMVTEEGLTLIYNVPSGNKGTQNIVCQKRNKNGIWHSPEQIDSFIPMRREMFCVQPVSAKHWLIFYQSGQPMRPEQQLGYREITLERRGNFHAFQANAYNITDYSFLTTYDSVHVLYIVNSLFSSQLIYRKKDGAQFGSSIVLWEGQQPENCLLFLVKQTLYATYMYRGHLYYMTSTDQGVSFSRPMRYRNKFCLRPVKARYLSRAPQQIQKFFCRELYTDSESAWDIQLLPELYEDFYPTPLKQSTTEDDKVTELIKLNRQLEIRCAELEHELKTLRE